MGPDGPCAAPGRACMLGAASLCKWLLVAAAKLPWRWPWKCGDTGPADRWAAAGRTCMRCVGLRCTPVPPVLGVGTVLLRWRSWDDVEAGPEDLGPCCAWPCEEAVGLRRALLAEAWSRDIGEEHNQVTEGVWRVSLDARLWLCIQPSVSRHWL